MVTFSVGPHLECIFHNLFGLLEYMYIIKCLHFDDFNPRKNVYLPKVSKRAIGFINFERPFFELFRQNNELVSIGLKTLLHEGLSTSVCCML